MKLLNLSKYKSRFAAMALVLLLTAGGPGQAFAAVNPTPDPQEPSAPSSSAADTGSSSQPNPSSSETPASSDAGTSSQTGSSSSGNPTDNDSSSQQSSSSKRSSSKPTLASSKPSVRVNTDEDSVNRAASRAARATSDPDVLSSQDWNELLTSSAVSEADEDLFNRNTPEDNEKGSGGFSLLLAGGILCIVLGIGGIAFFVYSQFFADEPLNGKKKTKGKGTADLDSTMQFEDIQSDSSGKPLRDGYVPPKTTKKPQTAKRPATGVRPQPPTTRRPAQPKPPAANPDAQTRVLPTVQPDAPQTPQKPEGADKESFDWDTFFKDQEKK